MLFKNRRKLRVLFSLFTSLLLFLVIFVSGPVMSLESSDSAKNLVPALLNNADVRTSLSNKIVDQVGKGTDPLITMSIKSKRAAFVSAISGELSSPTIIQELQKDVGLAYGFVTTSEPSITIQVKPLFASLISAMSKVDPLFENGKKVLKDIEPVTLTRDASTPGIGKWLSYARNLYVALILLLAISLFFFLRFSANGKRALRGIGTKVLSVGVLAIAQFLAIEIIASKFAAKATDSTIRTVIPVAARELFSYYQSIGIALVVLGAVAILIATRLKTPTARIDQLPE